MSEKIPLNYGAFLAAVSGVLLFWLPVLLLKLTAAVFAFLIIYSAIRGLEAWIVRRFPKTRFVTASAVALTLILLFLLLYLPGMWFGSQAESYRPGNLLIQSAAVLEDLQMKLPAGLAQYLPASVHEWREGVAAALRNHAAMLQTAGVRALRQTGHIVIGLAVGVVAALQIRRTADAEAKPLAAAVRRSFDGLMTAFHEVFFAQVRISALNTALTSVYLLGILPLIGKPLPLSGALVVLTFLAGLIPVAGNLISNTFITLISLSHGVPVAVLSLTWLVVIHKLEYFFNAHFIGHNIRAAAWELLVVMLLCEAAFGLAGLVAAPVMYAQAKRLLADRGWL